MFAFVYDDGDKLSLIDIEKEKIKVLYSISPCINSYDDELLTKINKNNTVEIGYFNEIYYGIKENKFVEPSNYGSKDRGRANVYDLDLKRNWCRCMKRDLFDDKEIIFFEYVTDCCDYGDTFILIVDYDKMEVISKIECGNMSTDTLNKFQDNDTLYYCLCLHDDFTDTNSCRLYSYY